MSIATPPEYRDLPAAVIHWISYEALCCRDHLFCESFLRYPISVYLESRESRKVQIEVKHPATVNPSCRVDFAINVGVDPTAIIETKWIACNRDYKQEIFDDLARIQCFPLPQENDGRYLLLAGRHEDLIAKVIESDVNWHGAREQLFSGVLQDRCVNAPFHLSVRNSSDPVKKFWDRAFEKLKSPMPDGLLCELIAEYKSQASDTEYSCFLWKVNPEEELKQYAEA